MTPPEVILWQQLRARPKDLKFRRQHPIGPYIADFYCPAAKLIIEVDGLAHDFEAVAIRDEKRDAWLSAEGFTLVRVPADEVFRNLDAVLITILAAARP
jgi:very-short-patch-repair endonuclease